MHVVDAHPLSAEEAAQIDAYWRAANYLSVGQIYPMGNPLLREPLTPEPVKPRLLGHWGTTPGLNLLYAHLSRIIAARSQDIIYVTGSGHGGPGLVANANGGRNPRDLELPDVCTYGVNAGEPAEATRVLGGWLRDVLTANVSHRNFRLVGQDGAESNRLGAVLEVTQKAWQATVAPVDEHLGPHGRVMEILSEHTCQGWLEGYMLTRRHGLFSCYEAFVHIVDSMVNQHAKWLRTIRHLDWRKPVPSLNVLLTSHVWHQDHNGASHQDLGFIDHVMNKKAEVVRVYLPPDAHTLLSVADHCLRSRNYVNVIVAGKQPAPTWLDMDAAALHCARGLGIWDWASNDDGDPDVVLAAAGDVATLEILAATDLLRRHLSDLKVRVVNVVDLMRLQPTAEHPRAARRRVRRHLHHRPAGRLRLPRPPVAHPPPRRAPEPPRARVQGGGHHHTVRHARPQRHGPLPPRHGRHRQHPRTGPPGGGPAPADGRQTRRTPRTHTRSTGEDLPEVRNWTWPAA